MSKFQLVSERYSDLPYMRDVQAKVLREIILEERPENLLEVGFFQGKSSAYIAAILEDLGAGHLVTIDKVNARDRNPNIVDVLDELELSHRADPIFAVRSYTWELQKLIQRNPRPQFDLCYFDGGHTWDETGFGVLLVDMLLRPGGIIILDDMDWSISKSSYHQRNPLAAQRFSEDEREAATVRRVWDLILPHLGYECDREIDHLHWGIARKPLANLE